MSASDRSQIQSANATVEISAERAVVRILLVDNDAEEARRSGTALRDRLGNALQLVEVASLAAAIRELMQGPFDAVVLEWALGDAGGLATLAGVRGAAPGVPVVVYSRQVEDEHAVRALRAGALECTSKQLAPPTSLARLLAFAWERQRRLSVLESARMEAAHRATHDPLTGLSNRALFLDQLDRALALGARNARKTGLLFVDLDGFKTVNDTHGHAQGDALLRIVATRLLASVRRSDAVARIGGDEFVVLLPDVTSRRDIAFVKETILTSLREPLVLDDGRAVAVGASVGSAMSPLDGVSGQDLLDAADADMYRDKAGMRRERPRDAIGEVVAELEDGRRAATGVADSISRRRELRLRTAFARGEFEVFYLPMLDVVADRLVGAEAQVYWREPDVGLLGPAGFLALAEDTGLIVPIGEFVLRAACAAVAGWRTSDHASGAASMRVSVNLSAVQLREHGFPGRVAEILEETRCLPEALTLEVTETQTAEDGEAALDTLRALKALGVRLVVDDFGAGHASLTFLREAPVDGVKIDRRFISQLLLDPRDQAIVSSLARLGRGLGLEVAADGVENAEQAQRLARLQCFVQQGRHFSDPLADAQLLDYAASLTSRTRHAAGSRDATRDGAYRDRTDDPLLAKQVLSQLS